VRPDACPNCGAEVPLNAKSCPECGADESTGWSDESYASSLGLPDDSFDYNEFVEREFGRKKARPYGIKLFWWFVAIVVLALFVLGMVKWWR